jgi:hypothetical protein
MIVRTPNLGHPHNMGKVAWYLASPAQDMAIDYIGQNHGKYVKVSLTGHTHPGGQGSWKFLAAANNNMIQTGSSPLTANLLVGAGAAYSIAAWVWVPLVSVSNIWARTNGNSTGNGAYLELNASGKPAVGWLGSAAGANLLAGPTAVSAKTWARVCAVVFNVANTAVKGYIALNGIVSTIITAGTFRAPASDITNGSWLGQFSSTQQVVGVQANSYFDDLCIWNRPLSLNEMAEDYVESSCGYPNAMYVREGPRYFVPVSTIHPWWTYSQRMMGSLGGAGGMR